MRYFEKIEKYISTADFILKNLLFNYITNNRSGYSAKGFIDDVRTSNSFAYIRERAN